MEIEKELFMKGAGVGGGGREKGKIFQRRTTGEMSLRQKIFSWLEKQRDYDWREGRQCEIRRKSQRRDQV